MFTKCPSCHTEISFEPPSNAPAGYKHRIKCPNPSCGVTISVALPPKQVVAPAPMGTQVANPAAIPGAPETSGVALEAAQTSGKVRYKGRARSLFMLILSLIFVAANVLAYLIRTGVMPEIAFLGWTSALLIPLQFDGILLIESLIADFQGVLASLQGEFMMLEIIMFVVPTALLLFAGILFIANLIGVFAGKYGKTGNVIFSILIFLLSVACFGRLLILGLLSGGGNIDFAAFFNNALANDLIGLIGAGVGLLMFIFAIIFAAIRKKTREPKIN
jgi:hypothetical protein